MEHSLKQPKRSLWRPILFGVWFVAIAIPLMVFHAGKAVSLPQTEVSEENRPVGSKTGQWHAVHILAENCPCSGSAAKYLQGREARSQGLVESAWFAGELGETASELNQVGFTVEPIDAERLVAQYGIHGGPWLIVFDPSGELKYSGGYGPRKPVFSSEFRDRVIVADLIDGQEVTAYPAFGCATSRWLQDAIDPVGVKYSSNF